MTERLESLRAAAEATSAAAHDMAGDQSHEQWNDELASLRTILTAVGVVTAGYVEQFPRYAERGDLRLSTVRGRATPASTLLEATGYAQIAVEALLRASTGLASAHANIDRLARVEPAEEPETPPGDEVDLFEVLDQMSEGEGDD
jgi:hypothetical protein